MTWHDVIYLGMMYFITGDFICPMLENKASFGARRPNHAYNCLLHVIGTND